MTRITRQSRTVLLMCLASVIACGGGGGPTGPGNNGGQQFSATIDGTAWTSGSIYSSSIGSANGTFSIAGGTGVQSAATMSLTLFNISAPGTYPLGVGGSVPGGIASISQGVQSWSTPLSGAAGTVTVTSVSSTRLRGTFSYTATPFSGNPTNNRVVSNGVFDMPITASGSVAVPAHIGSTFGGTLGGAPWNAATVVMVAAPSSGTLTVGASNTGQLINLIISGYNGVGVYAMNSGVARYMTVMTVGAIQSWGGSGPLASGTVSVTSATATRIKGTYDVTLQASVVSPGAGTRTLTGAFDLGIAP